MCILCTEKCNFLELLELCRHLLFVFTSSIDERTSINVMIFCEWFHRNCRELYLLLFVWYLYLPFSIENITKKTRRITNTSESSALLSMTPQLRPIKKPIGKHVLSSNCYRWNNHKNYREFPIKILCSYALHTHLVFSTRFLHCCRSLMPQTNGDFISCLCCSYICVCVRGVRFYKNKSVSYVQEIFCWITRYVTMWNSRLLQYVLCMSVFWIMHKTVDFRILCVVNIRVYVYVSKCAVFCIE